MNRIWHISDTHTYHNLLDVPDNIDIVIFSGDCSNPRDPYANEVEVRNFIEWYSKLNIKYKIFVAGNHDSSIDKGFITKDNFIQNNIIYLENNFVEILGLKIWGSPYTPSFGEGWSFNMKRHKLHDLWATIPEDIDIIICHGPPKGALDLSYHYNVLEFCGCAALSKRVRSIKPKLCCFGHIHNREDIINAGYIKYSDCKTIYSNGSVVTDFLFGKLTSNGNIFEL